MPLVPDDRDLKKLIRLARRLRTPSVAETEAGFQASVRAFAELHGWVVFSLPDSRRVSCTGFQDLTLRHDTGPTPIIVAELKREGEKPRADQDAWLRCWRLAGVPAYVWRPSSWGEIERVLTAAG